MWRKNRTMLLSSKPAWCTQVRSASVTNTENVMDDCFSSLSPHCSLTYLQLYIHVHENSEVQNGSDNWSSNRFYKTRWFSQRSCHCWLELLLIVFLWPGLVTRGKFGKPLEPRVQSKIKWTATIFSIGILLQTLFVKTARFLSSSKIDRGLTAIYFRPAGASKLCVSLPLVFFFNS